MATGQACFYCRNSKNGRPDEIGWKYDCALDIDNSEMNDGIEQVVECPKGKPRQGFQLGGYYTHMWFEAECQNVPPEPGQCLSWTIMGDGEFPIADGEDTEPITFHICDFEQIEEFVEFWRGELEKQGLLSPRS